MALTTDTWLDDVGRQVRGVVDALWSEVRENGILPLLEPVGPFNRTKILAPAITVGGLVAGLLLSGMAVTAFGSLVIALLALWLLLVEVFGVSIELHPFGR